MNGLYASYLETGIASGVTKHRREAGRSKIPRIIYVDVPSLVGNMAA